MTHLADLLDDANLRRHVEARNIAAVRHPSEPLTLFNYTQRCQFTGAWDHETRSCRGLIVADDGTVLARPFPKFHNLHEHGDDAKAGTIDLVPPLRVFDKVDGSLGIAYVRPSDGRLAWATRGSFTSGQAEWATRWWRDNHGDALPPAGATWLAEIVYPENRIVVDYGDRAGLVFLAALDIDTGEQVAPWGDAAPADFGWPSEVVEDFGAVAEIDAVDRNVRSDAEGYVVVSADRLTRVKLKADEYMRLHKILTGVSSVTVWEMLSAGSPLDLLYERVPDEFAAWLASTVDRLQADHETMVIGARADFDRITALVAAVPEGERRKAFALEAVKSPHRALLFAMLDGKPTDRLVWKVLRPERESPFVTDADAA